jgi:hypothetical protein
VEDSVGLFGCSSSTQIHSKARAIRRFLQYPNTLGRSFIAGGDYNAKHTDWGSRLITPRRLEALKAMERENLKHLSPEGPTYWPSDRNELSKLVDFCATKGIPQDLGVAN